MAKAEPDDEQAIEHRAVHLLGRREHSAAELKRKLQQKGFVTRIIDEVIERLQERDWQSDERFTEGFVRQRVEAGYGPLKIRADLQQKGVASDLVAAALEASATDWTALAQERYLRRFGDQPPEDEKERARRQRHLYQRGFLPDQVRTACSRIERADDFS
ncbi:regulatory protein RecX [Aliidiomarina sp. Khilg15.8]